MKIALVSPYDYPYPGGVTEHVRNLAEQFRSLGHEVHVIAPSSADPASLRETPWVHRVGGIVSVSANGSVARLTPPMQGYLQVKRLLAYQSFDIVHLHEPMMPSLPLTVLRHSQAVNIGTFHAYGRTNLRYFYAKPMLEPQFKKLHGRIAVSRPARDFVAQHFPAEYRIIPNGIEYARFATPRAPIEPPDDRLDVLFVGRLEKRKGLRYLLRAWTLVRREIPAARLFVVGGGGRRLESYRRWAQRQDWSDVVFTGHVSAEELVRRYQSAAVFCAPSTGQESFGIVLLEAMAAGRPLVATRIPGYAEVVTDGREGLLVQPEDAEALAAALLRLLRDAELRRQMGARGRETAVAYDWPLVADRVLAYYHETLDAQMSASVVGRVRFGRVRRAASGVAHLLAR